MASLNTPILKDILKEVLGIKQKVDKMEGRLDKMEGRLDKIEGDFKTLNQNISYFQKSLSIVQEKSDIEYFRRYMTIENPTLNISVWPFGDFYDIDGRIVTDIDGCLTIDSFPKLPEKKEGYRNNSKQAKYPRNDIYFLESKNLLDKEKFDKKIFQFNVMLEILSNLDYYNKQDTSEKFKEMIKSNPLKSRPTNVYFIFSANDISIHMRSLILEINNNTLTEEIYKNLVVEMFLEHSLFKTIRSTIKDSKLKELYNNTKSFDHFQELFKNPQFEESKKYLQSFFTDYNNVKVLYSNLQGIIGYIFHGEYSLHKT